MSEEERLEQEEREDEDVEAHKKMARKIAAGEEPGTEESDDVEAHARKKV
jgi:hypothetical protein